MDIDNLNKLKKNITQLHIRIDYLARTHHSFYIKQINF